MSVKRLIANNMNEGLRRVRDALGPDAMIIKTIKRNGKIEFFVETSEVPEMVDEPHTEVAAKKPDPVIQEAYRTARLRMLSALGEDVPEPVLADHKGRDPRQPASADAFNSILSSAKLKSNAGSRDRTVNNLLDELQLSPSLSAKLRGLRRIDELIDHLSLMVNSSAPSLVGIHAFVGPAGSGKTTSLTKLITRQVMQFGPESCAIVNCDRYRAGARNQLTRLGELLDIDVVHVSGDLDLNQAIGRVSHRDFVAIDMPGLGMQDPMLGAEMFKLKTSNYDIHRFLVLPVNLQLSALVLAADTYALQGKTDCILTRLDEAPALGQALSFLALQPFPLAYTTDGPHIPEDLHAAHGPELVQLAIARLDDPFAKAPMYDFTNRDKKQSTYPQDAVNNMVVDV